MGTPGVPYLGFSIPFYFIWNQGQRWRTPGGGRCSECDKRSSRVYIRGDSTPYCEECIAFDIVEANPSDEMKRDQLHPPTSPIETLTEDDLDLSMYELAFS